MWETLVAGDEPEHYGIACKRVDARDDETKSVFNRKREMPDALRACIENVDARLVVLSYNDESWIALDELLQLCSSRGGRVVALAFDSARYVGAQIGVHNPDGRAGRRGVAPAQPRVPARVRRSGCGRARHRALRRRPGVGYADAAIIRPRSRNDGVAEPSVNSYCFSQRK